MRTAKFCLLLGLMLLVMLAITGCLGQNPSQPQALFTASPVEQVIPFTSNFDGTLSYDPNGRIVSYLWNFGDGAAGNGPQAAHTYKENGVYVAQLTVIDSEGISSSSSITVHALNPPPNATFSYSPKSWDSRVGKYIVGCNEWITFDASNSTDDGDIVAYDWNFGDGETDTGKVVEYRYLYSSTYNVVLTVTDDDGGKTTYIEKLNILGGPPCNGDIGDGGTCPGGGCY